MVIVDTDERIAAIPQPATARSAISSLRIRRFSGVGNRLVLNYQRPSKGAAALQEESMSKGNDRKKETKKKPAKSLMEKRAAKSEKRDQKKPWGPS
jgi:hypothetical protein